MMKINKNCTDDCLFVGQDLIARWPDGRVRVVSVYVCVAIKELAVILGTRGVDVGSSPVI